MTPEEMMRKMFLGRHHEQMPPSSMIFKNAISDGMRWVKAGMPIPKESLSIERLSICKACEFYIDERCSKCGCQMRAKTAIATSFCPIGKWGAVSETQASSQTQTNLPAA